MKRLLVLLLVLLAFEGVSTPAFAQTSPVISVCPGIVNPNQILAKGYQQLTVASTPAVGLTVPAGSRQAYITIELASIRYRDDGTNPTNGVGMLSLVGTTIILCGDSVLNNWKAIAGNTSATLNISYYGR